MQNTTVQKLFDLTGKTALVTGGTGWLGAAFCEALAEVGASVVISSSRNAQAARDAAVRLPVAEGSCHHGVELNHMDADSLQKGFQTAVEAAGQIDVLVNNGLEALGRDLTTVTFDEFSRHQINNSGYFILARAFRDHIVGRGGSGSIINNGSMYGQVASYPDAYEGIGPASPVAYHALKGGTIHMTRHLAAYWASDNIRVNCLSPGPFPNTGSTPEVLRERLSKKCPMGRFGLPWELKGAIVFLASEASSYMTGQNITIDGGWTAW